MNELLSNFSESEVASVAAKAKEFSSADESQFNLFVESFLDFAVQKPESSLKYAALAKELKLFVVSFQGSSKTLTFRDELVRLLHFKFDALQTDSNGKTVTSKNRIESTITFIGNLFNVGLLSPRLLRFWLSNLLAWNNKLPAEALMKIVQKKVNKDSKVSKDDTILISIVEMIGKMGIEEDEIASSQEEEYEEEEEKEDGEGAWNLQTINSRGTSTDLPSNILGDFRKFISEVQLSGDLSFDVFMFAESSEDEMLSCAQMLLAASKRDHDNAQIYAEVVKRTKIMLPSRRNVCDFASQVKKVILLEMKTIFRKESIDWNEVVKVNAFLGELYNLRVIPCTLLADWIKNVLRKARESNVAATTFLLLFQKVHVKLEENDSETFRKCMDFVTQIRDGTLVEIEDEAEESNENVEILFNPALVEAFNIRIDKQIQFDINMIEIFKVTTFQDRQKLVEILLENVTSNPLIVNYLSKFCSETQKLRVSNGRIFKQLQKELLSRIDSDLDSANSNGNFREKVKLFGAFLGEVFKVYKANQVEEKYKEKFGNIVNSWLTNIFKHSKIDHKLALQAFNEPLNDSVEGFSENYAKRTEKLFSEFSWLKDYQECVHNERSVDPPIAVKTARKINDTSTITRNFQQYMHALKSGNHQNVFFDLQSFDSPKIKTFPKDFLNYSLQNIEFAAAFAHFTYEIRLTKVASGNFLKQLVTRLEDEVEYKLFMNQIDWNYLEQLGIFMIKLYAARVIRMKFFYSWLDKLNNEISSADSQIAVKNFVQSFHQTCDMMKNRDLIAFKKYLKLIVKINERRDNSEDVKAMLSDISRKFQALIATVDQTSNSSKHIQNVINQIKNFQHKNIQLQGFSFLDIRSLVKCFFQEVSTNSALISKFTKAVFHLKLSVESSSSNSVFSQEMKQICLQHFRAESQGESENISPQDYFITMFIGELYNIEVLEENDMQVILKNISIPGDILKSNKPAQHCRYEAIIPVIKEKARENFENNKHTTSSPAVLQLIQKFELKFGKIEAQKVPKLQLPQLRDPSKAEFAEILKKVLSDQTTVEDHEKILTFDPSDFAGYFVHCAILNPQKSANFVFVTKQIAILRVNEPAGGKGKKFKISVITACQKRFEAALTENTKKYEQTGICKLIAELFNADIFTSRIIASCFSMLTGCPLESAKESFEVLAENISRKVIKNKDQDLLPHVRHFLLKKSISKPTKLAQLLLNENSPETSASSPEPSKIVQNFYDYLLTKTFYHSNLEISTIELFKICQSSERDQCAEVMINIALTCPEKTPVFAEICKDFADMFRTMTLLRSYFNKEIRDKLNQDFSNMKNDEIFWSEAKKYGRIFEFMFLYDLEDIDVVKLWLEKIFSKSKMEVKFAEFLLTKANDDDVNNNQDYLSLKSKLMTTFPWLQKFVDDYNPESSDDEENDEETEETNSNETSSKFGTIFKENLSNPALCQDIKKYLDLKKKGRNVIFNHKKIRQCSNVQRRGFAKLVLNEAMEDPRNVQIDILFIKEIVWTGWSMGNFLRIMLDVLIEYIDDFIKTNIDDIEWDVSKLGNFLSDLYSAEILKLVLMNSWLDKLHDHFSRQNSQIALITFLLNFEKIAVAMKRRSLKDFEKYIKKVEGISMRNDLPEDVTTTIQKIMRTNHSNVFRSNEDSESSSVVTNLMQQIKLGVCDQISLETLSTSDLETFAKCCVDEALKSPESMRTFLNIINGFNLMITSFRKSAHKIFRQQLNSLLVKQFEVEEESENVIVSKFVAELFKSNCLEKSRLQSIFKKIKHPENYKTLFTLVRRKVEEHYANDPSDDINVLLHQKIENFHARLKQIEIEGEEIAVVRSQQTSTESDEPTNHDVVNTDTGAIPKRTNQINTNFASTSSSSSQPQHLGLDEFDEFLKDFSAYKSNNFTKVIDGLKLKSQDELTNFTRIFFEARNFVKNFSTLARLALTIENELLAANTNTSFKSVLLKVVKESSLIIPLEFVFISMFGELYNINWISDDELIKLFYKLITEELKTNHQLRTLKSLIKIVSLQMIKNKIGVKCEILHQKLSERRDNFADIHSQLWLDEILEAFDSIVALSTSEILGSNEVPQDETPIDPKDIESVLKTLNPKNFNSIALKVQSMRFKDDNEIIEFVKAFVKCMLDSSQPEQRFSALVTKIEAEKFKEILLNEIQHVFLDLFNDGLIVADKLNEVFRLIIFIGDLYNLNFIDNDCINLVLDVLFGNEKSCNETADCINNLLVTAGLKLEVNNQDKMDRYFKFLEYVMESEKGTSYRSKMYKELLESRQQNKKNIIKANSEIFDANSSFDLTNVSNDPEIHSADYLESSWKIVSGDHEQIESQAKTCKEMSTKASAKSTNFFEKCLIDFLRKEPFDGQNVNKTMFVAELFKHELISEEVLELWIKPKFVEKFPLEIVTKIINSISSAPNANQNVKTTALLMTLEEIVADESAEVFAAIKSDIAEIMNSFQTK